MINVRDLYVDIKMLLNDTYGAVYSDEEIIRALNMLLHYVNLSLIRLESNYVKKTKTISYNESGVSLPSDFASFISFDTPVPDDGWEIVGNKIQFKNTFNNTKKLKYYYLLSNIETLDDTLNLPYLLYSMMVNLGAMIVSGKANGKEIDNMVLQETMSMLEANRPIDRPMPFYI